MLNTCKVELICGSFRRQLLLSFLNLDDSTLRYFILGAMVVANISFWGPWFWLSWQSGWQTGSNLVISKFYYEHIYCFLLKRQKERKRGREWTIIFWAKFEAIISCQKCALIWRILGNFRHQSNLSYFVNASKCHNLGLADEGSCSTFHEY